MLAANTQKVSMYTTTLILTAVGALNWGLVALFDFNLVAALFGIDTVLTNIIYLVVAASAIYLLVAYPMRLNQRTTDATRREQANRPVTTHR